MSRRLFVFHNVDPRMQARMQWLEAEDSRDRQDGTPRMDRLRQIPPDTGRFLAILAAGTRNGEILEIGTSAGYSTLWLTQAAHATGRRVTTIELLEEKVRLATETFQSAGVEHLVELIHGDARAVVAERNHIAFCFLDAEKEDYLDFYELVVPRLVPGGLLVADNVISHAEALNCVIEKAESDERVDSVLVPIGKGELVCRCSK